VRSEAVSSASLARSFEAFNESSRRLEAKYEALGRQVAKLEGDLARANAALRTRAEELDQASGLLAAVLDHITDCVAFVESCGKIRFANRRLAEFLRLDGPVAGRDSAEVFAALPMLLRAIDDAVAGTREAGPNEEILRLADGSELRAALVVRPFVGRDGRSEGAVVVMRDMADARAFELSAGRNGRLAALGRMAAQLSHEFRNVLGGMEGMSELVVDDVRDMPVTLRTATRIRQGLRDLGNMVGYMLDFSRPSRTETMPVNINEVMTEAVELERAGAARNGFHVDISLAPGALLANADRMALRQVLLNLLRNAREAMPEGGTLRASITRATNRIRVVLDDEGPGIPARQRDVIFDPFYTTKSGGTGLGLANCHKLVEAQSGSIEADSAPSGGARFIIDLPAAPEGVTHTRGPHRNPRS